MINFEVTRTHYEGRIQVNVRLSKDEVATVLHALEYELDAYKDEEIVVGPPEDAKRMQQVVGRFQHITAVMLEPTPARG